jgi:mono/diheme cytochrome c family protein
MSMKFLVLILVIPAMAMAKAPDPASAGRVLLDQLNCTACHAPSEAQSKWLSPKRAASLTNIASRALASWLVQYLRSPQETMPGTTMPDVLATLPAGERAAAAEVLTHYLLSGRTAPFKRMMPDRAAVKRGEALFHRIGCVACHSPQNGPAIESIPLPRMEEKWAFEPLRRFLLDPLATRPSGRMPALRLSDGEAADIAHYLLRATRVPAAVELATYRGRINSLEDIDSAELSRTSAADSFVVDERVWDRAAALRFSSWVRIDQGGEYTFHFTVSGAGRLAIDGNWLAGEASWERNNVSANLKLHLDSGLHAIKVDYVHRGNKPPAMALEWEGRGIARGAIPISCLRSDREEVVEPPALVVDPAKAATGKAIYERLNCAACHEGKAPANAAAALAAMNPALGCLDETHPTLDFHLTPAQRVAIRAGIESLKSTDLPPPAPRQRLAHAMAFFNCNACHTRDGSGGVAPARNRYFTSNADDTGDEGRLPPNLDGVGDKLKLSWLEEVLAQGTSVRPYMDTRMPRFGKENVGTLAGVFVAIDRKPKELAASPDAPAAQKEAGRKIVGVDGASCIVCHRFNRQPAQTMQIIDLVTATQRLNPDWFRAFLVDPNRFHPGTRMPSFWPEGISSLPKVLGGDTQRQLAAIWTYLADGDRAKFPEGMSRQSVELVVGGEAIVYRGKLWEAGFRAVAVGYPGGFNAAFDAEEMRLSLLWRGRFLNAGPHWQVQGMGQIHPLGTSTVVFPHGSPLAILANETAPWPVEPAKVLGMKFGGYQLDNLQRPTLFYSFQAAHVEDFLTPLEDPAKPAIRRTITITDSPKNLFFRAAAGKLVPEGENGWRFNDAITIRIKAGGKALIRGAGERQELLVPVSSKDKKVQLEIEYAW